MLAYIFFDILPKMISSLVFIDKNTEVFR
jgi:hypothetical protein